MLPNAAGPKTTAIGGSQYLAKNCYGNPVNGANADGPYAGSTAIFENDNHSILTAAALPIPEPPGMGLTVAGLALPAFRRRRG